MLLALIPIGIRVVESRVGWEESTYAEFSEALSAMNASHTNSSISNSILGSNIAYVKIGDHVAMYDRLSSETMDLTSYQGRLFAEGPSSEVHSLDVLGNKDCQASCDCKWYRLKGVRNLQYLIKEDANGELSAWQFGLFMSFQEGAWRKLFPEEVKKEAEYGCRERLEVLCQVSSAKDIARIEVLPGASTLLSSTIPVTEYRKYEEEIRTKTIEDHRTIEELLTIFRNMKDVLSSPQDIQAHLRVFRSELMRNNVETSWLAGELGPLMRYDRKIRLVFSDGSNTLLTYSAVSGAFSYYGKNASSLATKT